MVSFQDRQPIVSARCQFRLPAIPKEEFDKFSSELQQRIMYRTTSNDPSKHCCFLVYQNLSSGREYGFDEQIIPYLDHVKGLPCMVLPEVGSYDREEMYGFGQTICGVSGKPLKPFFISVDPDCKTHALFSVPRSGIVCRAQYKTDNRWVLKVIEVSFDYDSDSQTMMYMENIRWAGERFNEVYVKFQTPMTFAMSIATTINNFGGSYFSQSVTSFSQSGTSLPLDESETPENDYIET